MKLEIEIESGEGTFKLPARYEVCPVCQGHGKTDPKAWSNGVPQEFFAEDEDFAEDYFSGKYDVCCSECNGQRLIIVADENAMTAEQAAMYTEWETNEADFAREQAWERRMLGGA